MAFSLMYVFSQKVLSKLKNFTNKNCSALMKIEIQLILLLINLKKIKKNLSIYYIKHCQYIQN